MIGSQFIAQDDPPRDEWEAFVAAHPHGHLLQTARWAAVREAHGWWTRRLALRGSPDGPIVAGGCIHFRRLPYRAGVVGYLPRGPVVDLAHRPIVLALRAGLDRLARREEAICLTWEPPYPASPETQVLVDRLALRPGRPVQPRSTIMIDLRPEPAAIAAAQKPKWRYNTRLAIKRGVSISAATSRTEVDEWIELIDITTARDGFHGYSPAYYRDAWTHLCAAGQGVLLLARHERRLLAGVLIARCGSAAIYLYGASSNDDRHLMPNHLLQWEAMLWARAQGVVRYDMWGIPDTDDPDEPLRGVGRFKEGWGGQILRHIGTADRVYQPLRYTLLTAAVPAARRRLAQVRADLRRHQPAAGPAQPIQPADD